MKKSLQINLIAAMSINHVIGSNNRLPWHLPADWGNFHQLTTGHSFIMGRKSYFNEDALLSDKHNYVLTQQSNLPFGPKTTAVHSLAEAFARCAEEDAVFVLGGASVFVEALPFANYLYLTIVHTVIEGDAFFPLINWHKWEYEAGRLHSIDDEHNYSFAMNIYKRSWSSSGV